MLYIKQELIQNCIKKNNFLIIDLILGSILGWFNSKRTISIFLFLIATYNGVLLKIPSLKKQTFECYKEIIK